MSYDAAAYQPATGQTVRVAALFTAEHPGRLITGPEKLVQRFLLELMTETGSMLYKSARGGSFMDMLRQSAQTEADIFYAFYAALVVVASNLQAEEEDTDPDDERYGSATLNKVEVAPGEVRLGIGVETKAGTLANVSWPIVLEPQHNTFDFSSLGVQ